jgi:hypothetical protein
MTIVRQNTVTPAEIALRRELEIRFSRILAEILRQPRSEGIPLVRVGSSCAVAILNAIQSICPFKIMDEILDDFFEEAFAIWSKHMTVGSILPVFEPSREDSESPEPEILEPEILEPIEGSRLFAHLLHSEKTKETDESEIDQVLLEVSRNLSLEDQKK